MRFVKYDITFETEREIFVTYGLPPHVDYLVKFNHIIFIEDEQVQELTFEFEYKILIYMIGRGNLLSDILNNIIKNEKVTILRDDIYQFNCDSPHVHLIKSFTTY